MACDQLIQTAAQKPDERPPVSISLLPALVGGFSVRMLVFFQWLRSIAVTAAVPIPGISAANSMRLPIPLSPLYLGIGALLTFPTAALLFAGGLVNSVTQSIAAERGLSSETYRWVGGAAMVVAVVYSLINYAIEGARKKSTTLQEFDERLLEVPNSMRVALAAAIASGAAILILILARSGIPAGHVVVLGIVSLVLVSLLSGLGGLLSLQVGASASPVSGTVFMAMLVLSVTAMGLSLSGFMAIAVLQPVIVACCVAIAAANDSSQDYKTMQLNGFPIAAGFFGQFLGCVAGACTVPFALAVAHKAFGLGTAELPCPQASFFGTVLQSLFDPAQAIPWKPVGVGAVLGSMAVILEVIGRRRGVVLSSLAFAVGIYLHVDMGIGILLGNLAKVIATNSLSKTSHRGILSAAGLIAGDSLFSLMAGVLIVCQFDLNPFYSSAPLSPTYSAVPLAALCAFLAFTYLDSRRRARQPR